MFREIIPLLLALTIAIVGGVYTADRVTNEFEGFNSLTYGSWTAWPQAGSLRADPYARARAARTGRIALGSGEGLLFIARSDDNGDLLDAQCEYVVAGNTPTARYWTIRIADEDLYPIGNVSEGVYAQNSSSILRLQNGEMRIQVSSKPAPNNWLQVNGNGKRVLLLTLYDTSIATTTGVSEILMPRIQKIRCDDD